MTHLRTGSVASRGARDGALTADWVRRVRRALLRWYASCRRELPWRELRDPYAIWVSEVMLQQTQVDTVIPYFRRWIDRFSTVEALAEATPDVVLQHWEGLGYYSRARALQRAAQVVVADHGGKLPREPVELRKLPGIGAYTAGAIASIAHGLAEPVVDGNVVRVLCRLLALRGDPARAPLASRLWEIARALVPSDSPADFNQALMELGATVCRPRAPACATCPLQRCCSALDQNLVAKLPELRQRARVTQVSEVAALVQRRGRWLVVQLPGDAPRWKGMWQFPTTAVGRGETPAHAVGRALSDLTGLRANTLDQTSELSYSVTRYRVRLLAYRCTAAGRARALGCAAVGWHDGAGLEALAMPAAHRRLARGLAEPAD